MERKYIEDIEFLINRLESLHPCIYYSVKKEEIYKIIEEFKNNNASFNDYQFYYFVKTLLKKIGDAHTTCQFKTKKFPFPLRIIDGKVYIINASSEYSDCLFNEIIAINGFSIEVVIRELEKTISYTAKGHLENQLEFDLLRASSILSLPIMNNNQNEPIIYTLKKDGEVKELKLYPENKYNGDFIDTRIYWFEHDQDTNTLIIKYRACEEDKDKPMSDFVEEVRTFVDENNISNVIVDIRRNGGGHSGIIHPLLEYLESKHFNLITLVDTAVYSSGRFAMIDLKRLGSKIIGTEIGTQINCFGHVKYFELPNTKFRMNCSIRYWYYDGNGMCAVENDEFDSFYSNEDNKKYFLPSHFMPDVYVDKTIEDYENNHDSQLEWAIKSFEQPRL